MSKRLSEEIKSLLEKYFDNKAKNINYEEREYTIEYFYKLLESGEPLNRANMLDYFCNIKDYDEDIFNIILKYVSDYSSLVRSTAISVLGTIGIIHPKIIFALYNSTKDVSYVPAITAHRSLKLLRSTDESAYNKCIYEMIVDVVEVTEPTGTTISSSDWTLQNNKPK